MELIKADEFFSTARERHRIWRNRQLFPTHPEQWTKDPVFQEWRFCNVFRELDRTTEWFRKNIRQPLSENGDWERIVRATLIFRWFNRIKTGNLIRDLLLGEWDHDMAAERLKNVNPVVTGAYIIKGPDGFSKCDGVLYCIHQALKQLPDIIKSWKDRHPMRLQDAWSDLKELYYLGPFMSYEVVTDLRWTPVLDPAPDKLTWCNAGPGAARGLGWTIGLRDRFNSNSARDQGIMLDLMMELLARSSDPVYWPNDWPVWEMREVEHWLCEYDKYKRAEGGAKLKRRFTPRVVA